jgi:hypothetical protein
MPGPDGGGPTTRDDIGEPAATPTVLRFLRDPDSGGTRAGSCFAEGSFTSWIRRRQRCPLHRRF